MECAVWFISPARLHVDPDRLPAFFFFVQNIDFHSFFIRLSYIETLYLGGVYAGLHVDSGTEVNSELKADSAVSRNIPQVHRKCPSNVNREFFLVNSFVRRRTAPSHD